MRSALAVTAIFIVTTAANAQLSPYSQGFDGLDMASKTALGDDGWLVFGNVFDPAANLLYQYGAFPAPNGTSGFSSVATGDAGPNQVCQYLNVYNDYENLDHASGFTIEANVFQEQVIGADDLEKTFEFSFDYKASTDFTPRGSTTTFAFIKVLDPNAGYALVAFPSLETTGASRDTWSEGNALSITIDAAWEGHVLQFGFLSNATMYEASGVFYDNVSFAQDGCPDPTVFAINSFSSSTDGSVQEDFTIASYTFGSTDYIDAIDDGVPETFHIEVNSGPSDRAGFDYDLILDYSAYDIGFFLSGGPGIHRISLLEIEDAGSITDIAVKTSDGSSIGTITTDGNSIFWETTVADVLEAIGGGRDLPITIQWRACVPACAEDLDGSGEVGFADLTQLLSKWGPCCPGPTVFAVNSLSSSTDGTPVEDYTIASYEFESTDYIDFEDNGMPDSFFITVNSGPSDRACIDYELILEYSAYDLNFFLDGSGPGIHRISLQNVEVDGSIRNVALKTSGGSSTGTITTDGNSILWETTVADVLEAVGGGRDLPITIQWQGRACAKSCREDLDGSGEVGFADLTRLLSKWGPC